MELEPGAPTVFDLSDVPGGYDRLAALLAVPREARTAERGSDRVIDRVVGPGPRPASPLQCQ